MAIETSKVQEAGPSARRQGGIGTCAGAYRRILVPFDDSRASHRALDEAIALARSCRAELELITVFDISRHATGFEPARIALDQVLPRARAQVAASLAQARARAVDAGVACAIRLQDGDELDLPEVIATRVQESGADLIVLGTHGRHGIDRLLLGSAAEPVMRRSSVPVLVVRDPQE